jgi:class 3 adenylate cyclase/tetratricopeptide (TPR) repeat protein
MARDHRKGPLSASRAERRQITVMFCDLVGSTALSELHDPEDLREILTAYRRTCAGAISDFGGFVAQYVGDGVMAYFGYPKSHEFEAENAVRAAMRIVQDLAEVRDPPLEAHIGIATGTVVVDIAADGVGDHHAIVGQAPNLADRLVKLAKPSEIVIDERTQRVVREFFELCDLGATTIKGFAEPARAWRIVRESVVRSRSQAIHASASLTPLIGRENEVAQLRRCWEAAKAGAGQVALVSGEPGIGKSRLVRHVKEFATAEDGLVKEVFFSPDQQNSSLHAIIDRIERDIGTVRTDSQEEKGRKLIHHLTCTRRSSASDLAVFRHLLSLEDPDRALLNEMSLETRRARTLHLLEEHVADYASSVPALVVFEDAHWSDSTTLELLARLARTRVNSISMLLLITFRTGFVPSWPAEHYQTNVNVNRLSPEESRRLLDTLSAGSTVPAQVAAEIVARSDGVPLFLEEVLKATLQTLTSDEGTIAAEDRFLPDVVGVPSSLAASFMARLDRLGPVKHVAQVAAALGQRFALDLLQEVVGLRGAALREAIERLVDAEILYPEARGDDTAYTFKHALLQDAAYSSMLRRERKALHAQIVHIFESRYPEIARREPEQLANHCARGGLDEKAVEYRRRAGEHAFRNSANADAVRHFSVGLELLKRFPDNEATRLREMELRSSLARSLHAVHGGAAPEVGKNYNRARELANHCSDVRKRFSILIGCWIYSFMSARLHDAQALTREMLELGENMGNAAMLAEANRVRGMTELFIGRFTDAHASLEKACELYDPADRRHHAERNGLDPIVCCQTYLALAEMYLGYPTDAVKRSEEVLRAADGLRHPYTYTFALALNAFLNQHLARPRRARELAEEAVRIATANGFRFWAMQQVVVGCWAKAMASPSERHVTEMRRAVDAYLAIGKPLESTRVLALLAEVLDHCGTPEEALPLLDGALEIADQTGEMFYVAEIFRLRATIRCSAQQGVRDVFADFRSALDVAERQGAASWALKTAQSVLQAREVVALDVDAALNLRRLCEGADHMDARGLAASARALLDASAMPEATSSTPAGSSRPAAAVRDQLRREP